MRKFISFTIICLLVLSTGMTAFAAGPTTGDRQGPLGQKMNTLREAKTSEAGINGAMMLKNREMTPERKAMLQELREQIKTNHEELTALRVEIKDCKDQIKLEIKERLQDRDSVEAEDVLKYKDAVKAIKMEREQLRLEHKGKIMEQVGFMKQARQEKNYDAAKAALERIQAEQELRIQELTRILGELEDILDDLQE